MSCDINFDTADLILNEIRMQTEKKTTEKFTHLETSSSLTALGVDGWRAIVEARNDSWTARKNYNSKVNFACLQISSDFKWYISNS